MDHKDHYKYKFLYAKRVTGAKYAELRVCLCSEIRLFLILSTERSDSIQTITKFKHMTESEFLRLVVSPVIDALNDQIREEESFEEEYGGVFSHYVLSPSDEPSKRQYVQTLRAELSKKEKNILTIYKILAKLTTSCPCDDVYDASKQAQEYIVSYYRSMILIDVKTSRPCGATFSVSYKDIKTSLDITSCIPSRILAVILLYKYKMYETDKLLSYDEYFDLDKIYEGNQGGQFFQMSLLKDKVRDSDVRPWNYKDGKIDKSREMSSVERAFVEIYKNTLTYNNRGKASDSIIKTIWGGRYGNENKIEKVKSIYNKCKSTWKKALEKCTRDLGLDDREEILFDKDTLSVVLPLENITFDDSLIKCLKQYI